MPSIIKVSNLDDLLRRYQSGESELKLSREFGISRYVIRKRLISASIQPRNSSEANILRMARMTFTERQALTAASHIATKDRHHSIKERRARALTRQKRRIGISPIEDIFVTMLEERGIRNITQQKAIGTYNVDLAIEKPCIAVEIFGGNWHSSPHHANLMRKRLPYILNEGWNIVVIWINAKRYPLTIQAADYIISFIQELRLNKSTRSQYRMIRGNGENVPSSRSYLNGLSFIANLAC